MTFDKKQKRIFIKALVHGLLALPALWLFYNWYLALNYMPHDLGFNPQEASHHHTGEWALQILFLTLVLSPLSRIKALRGVMHYRRMMGLWSFFYVILHLLSYIWLGKYWDFSEVWSDILRRPYITVGVVALVMFIPLAVTSTKGWIKRLGAKNWQKLHYLVYGIALLAPLHFIMMRKGIQIEPRVYMLVAVGLLLLRFVPKKSKKHKKVKVG